MVNYRCHEKPIIRHHHWTRPRNGAERDGQERTRRAPQGCDRRGASNKKHAVCVLDPKSEILKQESITNSRGSLTVLHRRYPGAVMVMEVGMHSPWTSRFLKDLGHRVLVANRKRQSRLTSIGIRATACRLERRVMFGRIPWKEAEKRLGERKKERD